MEPIPSPSPTIPDAASSLGLLQLVLRMHRGCRVERMAVRKGALGEYLGRCMGWVEGYEDRAKGGSGEFLQDVHIVG